MDLQFHNATASISVSDLIFGCEFNEGLVHQAVISYMAGARAGTHAQKNRSAVRGGGTKPWRQKGTGRARAGTIRSPLWRGGGVTFAASTRDYSVKINKKMYRGAIKSILSELQRQGRLKIVEDISIDRPKTKDLIECLNALGVKNALLVTETASENLYLASRNVRGVSVSDVSALNPVSLVGYDDVVMTVGSIRAIEEWLK